MWNLLAIFALAIAGPADVTATTLDGSSATGELQSWADDQVVVATTGGPQTIPSDQLLELRFTAVANGDTGAPHLELVDGSVLPLADYTANAERALTRLQLPSPADPQPFSVPLEKVRAVRLQQLEGDVLPQWREILGLGLPSDLVVVSKRGGKSLDHLECVLGEVTDKEVELTVDGEEMRVPRSKVAGLIYYRSDEPAESPAALVVGPDGLRIAAAKLRVQGGNLLVDTTSRLQVAWPLADLASVDLSAGKVAFLGDLKPAMTNWRPLVGLPAKATRAMQFGEPRFNQSASGGPLTLAFHDQDPAVGSPEMKTFAKGLALRSRSEVVYRLPAGYSRLLAEAAIDPNDAASGNVQLSVFGDEELLVEKAIDGSDAPLPLDLDVRGVKRLKIVVDYGDNLDTGDWLNLCNARIVK